MRRKPASCFTPEPKGCRKPHRRPPTGPRECVGVSTRDFRPWTKHPSLTAIRRWAGSAGIRVWLFGGALRDLLLEREPHDWDLLASGPSLEAARSLARAVGGRVITRTGKFQQYRIISKQAPDRQYDLQSLGGMDAAAFLLTRDFSCNALAWPLHTKAGILDVTGGLEDMMQRRLRPLPRALAEDPVRALRALRLAAELDFSLRPDDLQAVMSVRSRLRRSARERVKDELFRLLARWPQSRRWCLAALELVLGPDPGRRARLRGLSFAQPWSRKGSRWAMMVLAAALGKGTALARERLRLSRAEHGFLKAWARLNARPRPVKTGDFLLRLAVDKSLAPDLAHVAAAAGNRHLRKLARACLPAAQRLATVKPFLTGDDMSRLTGWSGPRLGRLLLHFAALQALDLIPTRNRAKAWALEQKRSLHT